MVPSSVANRKNVDHPPSWKSDDPLNTVPVGVPGPFNPLGEPGPFPAVGISTFSDCIFPWPSYKVDHPEPASLTHHGEPEASECKRATLHKQFSFGRPGAGGVSETAVHSRLGHTFADPRSRDTTWSKSSVCHHTVTTVH